MWQIVSAWQGVVEHQSTMMVAGSTCHEMLVYVSRDDDVAMQQLARLELSYPSCSMVQLKEREGGEWTQRHFSSVDSSVTQHPSIRSM